MCYINCCSVLFLQIIIASCLFHNVVLSTIPQQDMGIKVLNVAEELQRESLPLKMGRRIYKLHGLKDSSTYEVKISYPASIPASFSLAMKKNLEEQVVSTSRRLLNTEKIIFKFESKNWNSSMNEAFVLVTVEAAGVVAKPNMMEQEVVLFNIIYEELLLGIPQSAWWVGIAALLCLIFAAVIPYYFPRRRRVHEKQQKT